MYRDMIAIGASAGGIEALKILVADLPEDLKASVLVVQHLGATSPGLLCEILRPHAAMRVADARDGVKPAHGCIYVAQPNRHLLVENGGKICLSRGPKENHARPAVDPLFRSVALDYGPRAIGVVLTGNLDDGTVGLQAIKLCGGAAVVQDPRDAAAPSMPSSALANVDVDHCLPLKKIGPQLAKMVTSAIRPPADIPAGNGDLEVENSVAAGERFSLEAARRMGEPTLLTCPDCNGVLSRLRGETPLRFRCHTGHAYSAQALRESLNENSEGAVWNAIRSFQEEAMLLRHIAAHAQETGANDEAARLLDESQRLLALGEQFREIWSKLKRD